MNSPNRKQVGQSPTSIVFGPDLLIAPVMHEGMRERDVWLPEGETWTDLATGESYSGGQTLQYATPLNRIPVFIREGGQYRSLLNL